MRNIIITTTNSIDGYTVEEYLGVVNANFVAGTSFISDLFASVSDFFGGTSGKYKMEMDKLYEIAKRAIETEAINKGGNAILGYKIDFDEISGQGKSMFMISVSGTAVKIVEQKAKSGYRYEIYQKLYNLHKFKECGIITDEQYNTEKDSILFAYDADILAELEKVRNNNDLNEYEIKKREEDRERRAAQIKELEELKARQREEEELRKQREIEEFNKQQTSQNCIIKAQNVFKNNSVQIYNEVKAILNLVISDPTPILNSLRLCDVKKVEYSTSDIVFTDKMSYVVGHLIKENKIAQACKYYIDTIHEDDLDAAKSYIQSVYEMITFSNQSSFEQIALKLIEQIVLGNTASAITELMKYAVCDKKTAERIIDLL